MKTRLIAAAVILAVLIAVSVIILTSTGGKQQNTASQAPATQCSAAQESSVFPAAPPSDLRWKTVGAMLVPTSATDGPARSEGPVWSCYVHTPMGAVLAAYDIFAGLGSPDWHAVAEHDVVPGQGQQAFMAAGEHQTYQEPAPGGIPPAVGFSVVSYTSQQATVETLASAGD